MFRDDDGLPTAREALLSVLGDDDVYIGSWGGVADIPEDIWQRQQWQGVPNGMPTPREGSPILRVQLDRKFARDWTVHLATPQLIGNPPVVGQPSTRTATITFRWGHHGSQDAVQMTWPAKGGTFSFHASFFELFVLDQANPPTARYNAWTSEGRRAPADNLSRGPVFTTVIGDIPPLATTPFVVANRARAVAVTWTTDALVDPGGYNTPLLRWFDNGTELSKFFLDASSGNTFLSAQAGWLLPVPCFANGGNIENREVALGDTLRNVQVHQFLDLG